MYYIIKMNYLIDLIIRPYKNVYNQTDLGDNLFTFSGETFKRIDFNSHVGIIITTDI
jgi:hypothetical protein